MISPIIRKIHNMKNDSIYEEKILSFLDIEVASL